MTFTDALKVIFAALGSVGLSGAIIFGLSSWLGKVWAARILERERNQLNQELERTKRDLDIFKETVLRVQSDKLAIYRSACDVIAKILAVFDSVQAGRLPAPTAAQHFDQFNEQRMQLYGYLAMLAPQDVMDAQDDLMDHLLSVAHGRVPYKWPDVRDRTIKFINEMRKDINIDPSPIQYRGKL